MTLTFRNFALLNTMSRLARASIAILFIFLALIGFAEARIHPTETIGLLIAALLFFFAWFKKAKRRV
jgi:hypothetical protein